MQFKDIYRSGNKKQMKEKQTILFDLLHFNKREKLAIFQHINKTMWQLPAFTIKIDFGDTAERIEFRFSNSISHHNKSAISVNFMLGKWMPSSSTANLSEYLSREKAILHNK